MSDKLSIPIFTYLEILMWSKALSNVNEKIHFKIFDNFVNLMHAFI
jgi:hypothetical protein